MFRKHPWIAKLSSFLILMAVVAFILTGCKDKKSKGNDNSYLDGVISGLKDQMASMAVQIVASTTQTLGTAVGSAANSLVTNAAGRLASGVSSVANGIASLPGNIDNALFGSATPSIATKTAAQNARSNPEEAAPKGGAK